MELWSMLGQRMCIGFEGTTLPETCKRLIKTYKIGNVILFRANLVDACQARALCDEIQTLVRAETGHDAWIAIDQEGGMVSRLPEDMITTPGAMALAATGDPTAAYEAGMLTAGELLRIGVNFNLAPVLDVNSNSDNPVIGVRSFGDTPQVVEAFSVPMITAFKESGILCAGKHFPGHGDTHLDSHIALPVVEKDQAALERMELQPFRAAISGGIPAIMTSHILFPALEPDQMPATMSRRILTDLLKGDMGFSGLVLSDGMEMGAIREHFGTPQGCVKALAAGVDIVFVCHDENLMEQSMLALGDAYERGILDAEENRTSVQRILKMKQRYGQTFAKQQKAQHGDATLPLRREQNTLLMRRTLATYPNAGQPLPALGASPFVAGPLAYRSTIASTTPDTGLRFASFFAAQLKATGLDVSPQPTEAEIGQSLQYVQGATGLLLGTYNAHLNKTQLKWATTLIAQAKQQNIPVIVVALRNPYDLKHMDAYAHRVAAFEYSANSFDAVLAAISGVLVPQGKLRMDS